MTDRLAGKLQPGEDVFAAARKEAIAEFKANPSTTAKVAAKSEVKLCIDHSAGLAAGLYGVEYKPSGFFSDVLRGQLDTSKLSVWGVIALPWTALNALISRMCCFGICTGHLASPVVAIVRVRDPNCAVLARHFSCRPRTLPSSIHAIPLPARRERLVGTGTPHAGRVTGNANRVSITFVPITVRTTNHIAGSVMEPSELPSFPTPEPVPPAPAAPHAGRGMPMLLQVLFLLAFWPGIYFTHEHSAAMIAAEQKAREQEQREQEGKEIFERIAGRWLSEGGAWSITNAMCLFFYWIGRWNSGELGILRTEATLTARGLIGDWRARIIGEELILEQLPDREGTWHVVSAPQIDKRMIVFPGSLLASENSSCVFFPPMAY